MEFQVRIHLDVFKTREGVLLYKYVVFSRQNKEVGHPYEYLYGGDPYVSGIKRRALTIYKDRVPFRGMHAISIII